jgi:CheY-specific phosphatase CheX
LQYSGPFKGCLLVLLSPEVLSILSSNMLGRDDSPDESVEHDALREMANVICGNSLPAIFGDKEPFHLGAPEVFSELDSLQIDSDYTCVAQICVPFDCGQADIILYAESKAAALLEAGQKPA